VKTCQSANGSRHFPCNYTLTNIGYAVGPMIGVVIAGVQPIAPFI
jgi:hypothetical protein